MNGVRILLVEKEDMIRALLGKTLRAAGYEVAGFARPREALDHVENGWVPQLVVVNLALAPGQSLRAQLQKSPTLALIPIVTLAGRPEQILERVNEAAARALERFTLDPLKFVSDHYGTMAARLPGLLARVNELANDAGELDDVKVPLEEARKGGRRMRSFVRYLVDFGREVGPERARVDVAKALEFAIDTALNEVTRRAKMVRRIRTLPFVMANERQLSHVFVSLLVNAAHAIEPDRVDDNTITIDAFTDENGWAVVEIADSGSGIAPDALPHIFEAYFSTKRGGGMGLGLFIVRTLVDQWGGTIDVKTEVGRGSRFRVELPSAPPGET
jgi:signal transduction histidine kinase